MKEESKATLASLKREMAKSRVAKSARKKYAHFHSSEPMTKERKSACREGKENPRPKPQ